MQIKKINVGNGTNDYPGNFTKKERKIIKENCKGFILHLFSGKPDIGNVKVDYTYGDVKMDVFDFLKKEQNQPFYDTIIIDAPYNKRFANKYQKIGNTPKQFIIFANARKTTELFKLIDNLEPEIIILKSWNWYCLKRYEVEKCYICYPGGYRKSTFLIIMKKQQ